MVKSSRDRPEVGKPLPVEAAWLSVAEACLYLGVSQATLYDKVMGAVTVKRLGKKVLLKRSTLDEYMEALPEMPRRGLRSRHKLATPATPIAERQQKSG